MRQHGRRRLDRGQQGRRRQDRRQLGTRRLDKGQLGRFPAIFFICSVYARDVNNAHIHLNITRRKYNNKHLRYTNINLNIKLQTCMSLFESHEHSDEHIYRDGEISMRVGDVF